MDGQFSQCPFASEKDPTSGMDHRMRGRAAVGFICRRSGPALSSLIPPRALGRILAIDSILLSAYVLYLCGTCMRLKGEDGHPDTKIINDEIPVRLLDETARIHCPPLAP